MKDPRWTRPPDPIPASSLCQVVTGDNGGCNHHGRIDEDCDCMHTTTLRRRRRVRGIGRRWVPVIIDWYVVVDSFTGIAVTYAPFYDETVGHELITEPELAGLL